MKAEDLDKIFDDGEVDMTEQGIDGSLHTGPVNGNAIGFVNRFKNMKKPVARSASCWLAPSPSSEAQRNDVPTPATNQPCQARPILKEPYPDIH
ncbi:MAG: hypothetical protein ABQ298_14505 [Puniceicoccaceae bacterium]